MYDDSLEASLRVRVGGNGGACEMEDSLGFSTRAHDDDDGSRCRFQD